MKRKFKLFNVLSEICAIIGKLGNFVPTNIEKFNKDIGNLFVSLNPKIIWEQGDYWIYQSDYGDILNMCKNDLRYCHMMARVIDMIVDLNKIIYKYDNSFLVNIGNKPRTFYALNDNVNITGVYITPKTSSLRNKFVDGKKTKLQKSSLYWTDLFNDKLNNFVIYTAEEIKNFNVKYCVYSLRIDEKDCINIGLTPLCNRKMVDIFNIDYDLENETFEIIGYKDPNLLKTEFLSDIIYSNSRGIDLLIGPEMLGVDEFSYNHCNVFSKVIKENCKEIPSPMLIISPSKWENNENYVTILNNKGQLLGKQNKISSFTLKENGIVYKEKLKENEKNELFILIIPGIGRIGILICVDYLNDNLQRIMTNTLKVDLLICPSYSPKMAQFINESGSVIKYGTRMLYLNSCSAEPNEKNIGYYTWPILEEKSETNNKICFEKK